MPDYPPAFSGNGPLTGKGLFCQWPRLLGKTSLLSYREIFRPEGKESVAAPPLTVRFLTIFLSLLSTDKKIKLTIRKYYGKIGNGL